MDELRAVLLCVAAALVCALMRIQKPEFRMAVAVSAGLAAAALSMGGISEAVDALKSLSSEAGVDGGTASLLLRAAGIALIAEFAAQLCRDAGESALAGRVALIARVAILALCMPVASRLVELLWSFAS